jgi:transposase InsO family protein
VGIERSSGIVFAIPIETKANAMRVVKEAVAKLERQLGERVRVIRSDGGTEFGGGEAIEWFKTTGIHHYTTPRYTPELNGAAERMVRTLKAMITTMLLDSKLPPEYWSYAARYAAVILMKTSNKDPSTWTRLTGRAGGVDSLLRFGQRCFVQVPKEVRRKNDLTIEKGEMGILLGPERDRQWLDYTTRPRRSDHSFKGRTIH